MSSLVAKKPPPPPPAGISARTRRAARSFTVLSLPDDVLLRILALLPVDQRLLARAVCARFRALAGTPALYSCITFHDYDDTVTSGLLRSAMAAAGCALRSLDLRSLACCALTALDLIEALERTPAAALVSLHEINTMPLPFYDGELYSSYEAMYRLLHGYFDLRTPPDMVLSIDQALKLKELCPMLSAGVVVIDGCSPVTLLRAELFFARGVTSVYFVDHRRLSPDEENHLDLFFSRLRAASPLGCKLCVWNVRRQSSLQLLYEMWEANMAVWPMYHLG